MTMRIVADKTAGAPPEEITRGTTAELVECYGDPESA